MSLGRGATHALLLGLLLMLGAARPADAQFATLDPAIATSVTLTPAQQDQIKQFIDQLRPALFSDDLTEAKRALDTLLSPLQTEGVSVALRQAFADELADDIEKAIADEREMLVDVHGNKVINARPYTGLRLAGEIATNRMLGIVTGELANKEQGRRFFAIHCTEMVFFAVEVSQPAVTAQALYHEERGKPAGLIGELGNLIVSEESPKNAAAIIRSLGEAGRIPDNQMGGVALAATRLIGERVCDRVRTQWKDDPGDEERLVWLTAGREVFPVVAQPDAGADRDVAVAAIRLAGHLVASVYRDVEAKRVGGVDARQNDDAALVQKRMLELAGNLLIFGEQRLAEATGRQPDPKIEQAAADLEDSFVGSGGQNFRQAALSLVSVHGVLTDAPYGFKDDEFIAP
ncbi:MAG: hypothetical protein H6810_09115 [Phycisphaeraceae bacterium]|nr:MAG: hypothetical protein H6810_09115 [Phycisphaeraceae bacterium]